MQRKVLCPDCGSWMFKRLVHSLEKATGQEWFEPIWAWVCPKCQEVKGGK